MKGGKSPRGYTIVEVLIVLAITGVMFLIAANFINSKQQKTAFTQGVNDMASRLQAMIEGVTDGRYSDQPIDCTAGALALTIAPGTTSQGQNGTCIFLGKFVHFDGIGKSSYQVFTLAAATSDTNLSSAIVTPVVSHTTQETIPQALEPDTGVVKIILPNGSTANTWGIGFTQGLGSFSAGVPNSGYQTVNMVYGQNVNSSSPIAALTGPGQLTLIRSANLCLTDGTRKATISIGTSNDNNLSVDVQIGTTSNC